MLRQISLVAFLLLSSWVQAAAAPLSITYIYDDLGRLTQASYSNGIVILYTYDAVGNRQTKIVTGAP